MTATLEALAQALRRSDLKEARTLGKELTKTQSAEPEFITLWAEVVAATQGLSVGIDYLERRYKHLGEPPSIALKLANFHQIAQDWSESRALYQACLKADADNVEALVGLAGVYLSNGNPRGAAEQCAVAIKANPKVAEPYLKLGEILQSVGSHAQAIDCYREALKSLPGHVALLCDLGSAHLAIGQTEAAIKSFNLALENEPSHALAHYNRGVAYTQIGAFEDARNALGLAMEHAPNLADAYIAYARIADGKAPAKIVTGIDRLIADPSTSAQTRAGLHLALALMFDGTDQQERAFENAKSGNDLRGKIQPFNAAAFESLVASHQRAFTAAVFDKLSMPPFTQPRLIVIAGLARSGTTLLAQMLGQLDGVELLGESPLTSRCKSMVSGFFNNQVSYPAAIQQLNPAQVLQLRQRWLQGLTPAQRKAKWLVDKSLGNYLDAGLARLIFPNAIIVDLARRPGDMLASMYFADFSSGHEYASNQDDLRAFYLGARKMLQHWSKLLGDDLVSINYESLVNEPSEALHELLEKMDVTQPEAILDFDSDRSPVQTLSAWQVRQPLNPATIGHWSRYEAQLPKLFDIDTPQN